MSEATDLVAQALSVIRKKGWCINIRQDKEGRVCALGALDLALWRQLEGQATPVRHSSSPYADLDGLPQHREAVEVLRRNIPQDWKIPEPLLQSTQWDDQCWVAAYNNTHSQEVVEEWFEKAAADERIAE